MDKSSLKKKVERALKLLGKLESAKPHYKELDELAVELKDVSAAELKGYGIECVDQFALKNTVYKPAGVSRFKLQICVPAKK